MKAEYCVNPDFARKSTLSREEMAEIMEDPERLARYLNAAASEGWRLVQAVSSGTVVLVRETAAGGGQLLPLHLPPKGRDLDLRARGSGK